MNVRCPYCRHSFNLTRDYLAFAVGQAAEKRQKYHAVECSNCRKMLKVSVKQMQRFVPADVKEGEEFPAPEATAETGDG